MTRTTGDRRRAAVALLQNVRNARRGPEMAATIIDELGAESERQRRRFAVLRRSDVDHEDHRAIARDLGLSRSQFYRDLREARERFADELDDRLALSIGRDCRPEAVRFDARTAAIVALRDTGQLERARQLALQVARDANDAAKAIEALCLCAELETELGLFESARRSVGWARPMLARIDDARARDCSEAACDLAAIANEHCAGAPAGDAVRKSLIERLRRGHQRRDRCYGALLVNALSEEATLAFERDDIVRAQSVIEEASLIVLSEGLRDSRIGVDVEVRASGIRALHPERVADALDATTAVVERAARSSDVRNLRVGMQMMSAHLLTLNRLEEARHFALEARTLIELFGSPLDRLIVLSNLARIEIHRGDGVAALQWIDEGESLACDAFSIKQALVISRAEALTLTGQAERATSMIAPLIHRLQRWPRLLGRAKLAEATALFALQRVPQARASSAEAVELARGAAGPLLHRRALELSVKLGGDQSTKAELRNLQAALNA
jgi:hypothetical protein